MKRKLFALGASIFPLMAFADTPPPHARHLHISESVLSESGCRAEVTEILPDSQYRVHFFSENSCVGGRTVRNRSQLAILMGNSGGLEVGSGVITRRKCTGVVKGFFPDGDASVLVYREGGCHGGGSRQKRGDLAQTRGSVAGFKFNDKVIVPSGCSGVVKGIYPNGELAILILRSGRCSSVMTIKNPYTLARASLDRMSDSKASDTLSKNGEWESSILAVPHVAADPNAKLVVPGHSRDRDSSRAE